VAQFPRSAQLLAPSGQTLLVNPAWERLWGTSLADLDQYNVLADPQLDELDVTPYLNRAFAGEAVEIPEVAYVPPFGRFAGQPRQVRATATPIVGPAGAVDYVVLIHEDVTDLVQATAELEHTHELLEESQRSAQVGSWSWNVLTDELNWTDEMYRIYGLEPGESVDYQRFLERVHPEDRSTTAEAVEQALGSGKPFAFLHRIVRPDGEIRTLQARGRVILTIEGRPERLIGSGQDVTDRLQADEIERTFAGMWEHAPVGIALYDVSDDFICVRHNLLLLELLGQDFRQRGSIVDVPLRELFDDESYVRFRAIFERARETGDPFAMDEFPAILLPDREPRWFKWSLTPVRNGDRVKWLLLTAIDVTGLVRTRQERQALLDAAVVGIYGFDSNGNCTFINPAACEMFGYAAEEILGRNLHRLTHYKRPDGSPFPIEECPIYRATQEAGHINLAEETFWRKDGSSFRTLVSVASLVDAEANITGAVASIVNIEDRLRAEEALRESEARFRTLAEASMAGVVLGDATGTLHYANDAYLRIIGYNRADWNAGRVDWVRLTPPESLEADLRAIAEVRERGTAAPYEKEYVTKSGDRVPVLIALSRIEHDGEEQLIGTVLDLSERKRLERMQDDFLAMVSHDLRTPLASVRGNAQLLLRRQAYREETVKAIVSAADRMGRLVGDLADIVRLESGNLELQRAHCDLVVLAQEQAAMARQRHASRRIQVEAPDGPVEGHWDPDRLAQVLQNIIGNALVHAPGSDILIRIEAHGDEAIAFVSDNGPGIDPDHLPHLFDRFYRARESGAGGQGLGLYISRMLVEAHNGRIELTSRLDKGSVFTIVLPRSETTTDSATT
jgi:PAS domain S-box-containing protein